MRATKAPRGKTMFVVGHLALGYITAKASSKLLKINIFIPLILMLSILPDIDLLLPILRHGGPTHSVILLSVMALPAVLVWKKQTIPYLVAIASHPLIGDCLTRPSGTSGVQLLFPLTSDWFAAGPTRNETVYVYLELALFSAFLILMIPTRDFTSLFKPHPSNLLLAIPILATVIFIFLQSRTPVPQELIIPHLILIAVLAPPFLIDVTRVLRHVSKPRKE